jgi:hypothetical protein
VTVVCCHVGFPATDRSLILRSPTEWLCRIECDHFYIYLLTAIELTPGDSNTVHICTQTMHITTQSTTLVGRLPGIRAQIGQTKIYDELTA